MAGSWSNQLLDQPGYITGSWSNPVQPSGRSGFKNSAFSLLKREYILLHKSYEDISRLVMFIGYTEKTVSEEIGCQMEQFFSSDHSC